MELCIYIYIYRERKSVKERERKSVKEREREREHILTTVYKEIHITLEVPGLITIARKYQSPTTVDHSF